MKDSKVLLRIARLPLIITGICLIVGFVILFVWSVDEKMEAHVRAGSLTLRYLIEFESVDPKQCGTENSAGGSAVILHRTDGRILNLLEWVGRERAMGEDSPLGRLLKERQLNFDQVPVASCRLWTKILEYLKL